MAPKIFGGEAAPGPVEGIGIEETDQAVFLELENISRMGEDILMEYRVKSGD